MAANVGSRTREAPLTKERAIVLQRALAECFGAPRFQHQLKEMQTKYGAHSKECAVGRRRLVREAQAEVVPLHGFEATDQGIQRMVVEFDKFADDPEVQALRKQLDELLGCDSKGGLPLESVVCMLREHFVAFGEDAFQAHIMELRGNFASGDQDAEFALCGPSRVILAAQRPILLKYGFLGSRLGARAMLSEVAKHALHPEVAKLVDAANGRLGLSPSARLAFRERLCGKAAGEGRAPGSGGAADVSARRLAAVLGAPDGLRPEPSCGRRAADITQARATALLSDLLMQFGSTGFQQKLQALIDRAVVDGCGDLSNIPGRQDLVMQVQSMILPGYGFTSDAAGVWQLVLALRPLMTDPSLAAKIDAMESQLRIPQVEEDSTQSSPVDPDGMAGAPGRPSQLAVSDAVKLFKELLVAYCAPGFQQKFRSAIEEGRIPRDPKRLIRSVLASVLPKYGFQASDAGLERFQAAVGSVQSDPDIAALIGEVTCALHGQGLATGGAVGPPVEVPARRDDATATAQERFAEVLGHEDESLRGGTLPAAEIELSERHGFLVSPAAPLPPASNQAAPAARPPSEAHAVRCSKSRATALFIDLESRLRCGGAIESAAKIKQVVREVLPMHSAEPNREGLLLVWQAAKPLLGDDVRARAERLVDELLDKFATEFEPCPGASPSISVEAGLELHNDLLTSLSDPRVQRGLSELFRKCQPTEAYFAEPFTRLTTPLLDAAFKQYGLPCASKDLTAALAALSTFYTEPCAQAVVSAVDEAMFGAERASAQGRPSLQAVVGALRAQLGAFSKGEFQVRIRDLQNAAAASEQADDFFHLPGRAELATQVQTEILPRFGFEATHKGVLALLAQARQLVGVPQVAALLDATNAKLGMGPKARQIFRHGWELDQCLRTCDAKFEATCALSERTTCAL